MLVEGVSEVRSDLERHGSHAHEGLGQLFERRAGSCDCEITLVDHRLDSPREVFAGVPSVAEKDGLGIGINGELIHEIAQCPPPGSNVNPVSARENHASHPRLNAGLDSAGFLRKVCPQVTRFLAVVFSMLALTTLAQAADAPDGGAGIAPPLGVSARAVPAAVKVGEVFAVEVVVTHEAGQRYELKAPGDLGAFDFIASERSRHDGADASTTTFLVKMQAFELGKMKSPPLVFEVSEAAGSTTMTVPGTDVEVVSTLPPDAQTSGENLLDIRPPLEVPVRTWRLLYALAALVAVALAAWAFVRYVNRPKPVVAAPAKPAAPLHLRTLSALDNLARENLPAQRRVTEFWFRLSEIMRGYLGERFQFDARESTTPELLDALRSRSTPGLPFRELSDFAHQSDFARYAKAEVTPDDCKVALELAYRIVHGTTAQPGRPSWSSLIPG